MGKKHNYPVELRLQVLSEYKQGSTGYKVLAKKFGLQRDTVRYWVLYEKNHETSIPVLKQNRVVQK